MHLSKWCEELKNCTRRKDLAKGSRIHAYLLRVGLFEQDSYVDFTLLNFYAKCGAFSKAQEVLDKLDVRTIVFWNSLITGYAQSGYGQEAMACFRQVRQEGIFPNVVTLMSILKACCSLKALNMGKEIHGGIIHEEFLVKDVLIGTVLVDMYAKCGELARARGVFDKIQAVDVVCWNVMIGGCIQNALYEEALNCFERMQISQITPNVVTFIYALKASGHIGAYEKGKQLHDMVSREGFLDKHVSVGNALVDMYMRFGYISEAEEIFDGLCVRDVVSWTALFRHGVIKKKGLYSFEQMKQEGVFPNDVTFLSIMKDCGTVGTIGLGKRIHMEILGQSFLRDKHTIGSALIDMYAKCGEPSMALEVFSELEVQNVISWTALIAGYGNVGEDDMAIQLFNKMIEEGIKPDLVTFTVVLHACGHSGVLGKGQMYFDLMSMTYGIFPTAEHHACMVGLFSRAGHFDKAVAVIRKMCMPNHLPVWSSLLGACQKWGNVDIGELAFKHMVMIDEKVAEAYVSMSNIYKGHE